jgi:hypothetical protein
MHKIITIILAALAIGQGVLFHLHLRDDNVRAGAIRVALAELEDTVSGQGARLDVHDVALARVEQSVLARATELNARMDGLFEEGRHAVQQAVDGHILYLGQRMNRIVEDGRAAVQREAQAQLDTLVGRATERLQTTTLDQITARRMIVVDGRGKERITLGTGVSEFTGVPNTSIKLVSPALRNPVILSSADEVASVSVSKRAILAGADRGEARIMLTRSEFSSSRAPNVYLGTEARFSQLSMYDNVGQPVLLATHEPSGKVLIGTLSGQGQFRSVQGLSPEGTAFSALFSKQGEVLYTVESGDELYPNSYLKTTPLKRIWGAYKEANSIVKLIETLLK